MVVRWSGRRALTRAQERYKLKLPHRIVLNKQEGKSRTRLAIAISDLLEIADRAFSAGGTDGGHEGLNAGFAVRVEVGSRVHALTVIANGD